jgi:hypothetical protein
LIVALAFVDHTTNADRVERLFPKFIGIARSRVRLARVVQQERLAVRQRPVAVAAFAIAQLIEEYVCDCFGPWPDRGYRPASHLSHPGWEFWLSIGCFAGVAV